MTKLTAALRLTQAGYPVFVLSPTKTPVARCLPCREADDDHDFEACTCLSCHGFYAATTDPGRIAAMCTRYPQGMLAIRTGATSGTVVIDVDPRSGGVETLANLDEEQMLPGTLSACTGSNGLHLYYRHPGGEIQSGANRLGPGVDVKADKAYVVAPPSRNLSGGIYSWVGFGDVLEYPLTPLPARLLRRLRPALAPVTPLVPRSTSSGSGRTRLAALVDVVLEAPEGERNARLHWAACRAAEIVAEAAAPEEAVVAILADAGRQVGLTASEIGDARRGTIGSGLRSGRRSVAA